MHKLNKNTKKLIFGGVALLLLIGFGVLPFFFGSESTQEVQKPDDGIEVLGAPTTGLVYQKTIIPITDSLYDLGTTTQAWRNTYFDQVCLTADTCRTTWPTGGSGGGGSQFSTSTPDTTGVYLNVAKKLGIGTTTPYAPLSVVGKLGVVAAKFHATSTTATSTFAGGLTTGSSGLNVLVNGKVGINTITPSTYLTVKGAGSSGASMAQFNAGSGNSFVQINDNGTVVIDADTGTGASPLVIKYNNSTKHTLDYQGTITSARFSSNNAVNNTPNPSSITNGGFAGTGGFWALRSAVNNSFNLDVYNGGAPLAAMTVLQDGKVGIGTTTPRGRFQVSNGLSATTTVSFGEIGASGSKTCFNAKNNTGSNISFYFVGTTLTVENNECK